jgi:thiosulfate/3-mercaptopyruvate sulfurtransferase
VSRDPVAATPGAFEAHVLPQTVTRIGTLREVVRLQHQLGPSLVIIDARTHVQFTGDEPGYGVRRPGHIPGAVNVPYTSNYAADDTLRPAAELRGMYQQAGVTKESANVAYCRTGMQACVTYFALRYLGFDATLYDGSYVEWSNAGESTGSITR